MTQNMFTAARILPKTLDILKIGCGFTKAGFTTGFYRCVVVFTYVARDAPIV